MAEPNKEEDKTQRKLARVRLTPQGTIIINYATNPFDLEADEWFEVTQETAEEIRDALGAVLGK